MVPSSMLMFRIEILASLDLTPCNLHVVVQRACMNSSRFLVYDRVRSQGTVLSSMRGLLAHA